MRNAFKIICLVGVLMISSGCNSTANLMNPFYEPPVPNALLGERTDRILNSNGGREDSARAALEKASSYRRAHDPQPVNPVVQPAVIRLMWIPDHLNKSGDLVPAHYYYVKVLSDRWAVTDAFELESQLGQGAGDVSNVPYVREGSR